MCAESFTGFLHYPFSVCMVSSNIPCFTSDVANNLLFSPSLLLEGCDFLYLFREQAFLCYFSVFNCIDLCSNLYYFLPSTYFGLCFSSTLFSWSGIFLLLILDSPLLYQTHLMLYILFASLTALVVSHKFW